MTLKDLTSQQIAIIGFGKEGQAILTFLKKHNLVAKIFDRQSKEQLAPEILKFLTESDSEYYGGHDYLEKALVASSYWFKSPGVLIPKDVLSKLQDRKITLTSQTAWFFEHSPAKIIGVTGTKGKGTTSSLIHLMLEEAGKSSYLTGNIGLESAFDVLEKIDSNDFVVFELSSFQLEHLKQSPSIGVCLMVTNDHFDYHDSQEEYWEAKSAIAKYQTQEDFLIYNADYPASVQISKQGGGQKIAISKIHESNPEIFIDSDSEKIAIHLANKESVIDTSTRKLLGKHNLENIAAAAAVATLLEIDVNHIESAINKFKGLPHRLQNIGTFNGVTFIDDSIATNPDTTIAAIKSIKEPTILLLGGADKNLNYQELQTQLYKTPNLKQVILIGEVGKKLHNELQNSPLQNIISGPFSDFQSAVNSIFETLESGDVVLLSPAATSFDMFKNYSERGDRFTQLVKEYYGK